MANELKYEWSLALRAEHWVRVIAIAALVFTGFYIHWPFISGSAESAVMSWMKFFHSVAAYALVLGLVVRVYLAFNSAFDRDWKDFSITKNLKDLPDMLAYYLFVNDTHKDYRKYNPLQAFAYLLIAVLIIFTTFTGAALYKGNAFGFINAQESFRWVNAMLGGESYTRIWHFLSMWVFIIFLGAHMYMGLIWSVVHKDKTFSSIFTGYKLKKKF
ncbi:MAG: Ni/Fe-hydrogenase, b-type cytochrome subunit [Nitrospirae bacterium]|nr:Ni/Fe-hydrogenase, b-type cytochrome subunit [Nitrospirota bacterium]